MTIIFGSEIRRSTKSTRLSRIKIPKLYPHLGLYYLICYPTPSKQGTMVFLPAVRAAQNGSENTETQSTPAVMSATDAGPGPSSVASSSRFAKPVGSMPPPHGPVIRKQNIACDACRTRKIRCQRTTIEQIVSPHL